MTSPQISDFTEKSTELDCGFAGIEPDRLYKTRELATLTNFTAEFYEAMRYRGEGPAWLTINRRAVRYLGKAVIEWLKAGIVAPSISTTTPSGSVGA